MKAEGPEKEKELRKRYKCTAGDNDGWCDGTKRGSRMRCPAFGLTINSDRICWYGWKKKMPCAVAAAILESKK